MKVPRVDIGDSAPRFPDRFAAPDKRNGRSAERGVATMAAISVGFVDREARSVGG